MRRLVTIVLSLASLCLVSTVEAQQSSSTSVPNLIRYSGALKDAQGTPVASTTVGVTFAIYKQPDSGAPIWQETQNVTTDAHGSYSVLLGNSTATGLPNELFSSQEERWLAVQAQGEAEQPRVLLVSVPYAFKAHEAETLGGKPASAFALAPASGPSNETLATPLTEAGQKAAPAIGHGTPGYIPIWLNPVLQGNSAIFQSNGKIGIGTTKPAATLDVRGPLSAQTVGASIVVGTNGVGGSTNSTMDGAAGVAGYATGTSGFTTGVFGQATSSSGVGGLFQNLSPQSGAKILMAEDYQGSQRFSVDVQNGVFGQANSGTGAGGLFQNLSMQNGAKLLVAEDSQNNQRFSVDNQGNIRVLVGNAPGQSVSLPVNHARLTFQSSNDNDYSSVTLTWAFPFPDTNYTATCTPQAAFSSENQVWYFQIASLSPSSITIEYANYSSQELTIHCIGVHD